MPVPSTEVVAARKAIKAMLAERPRPTQKIISAATGLTQGYVAKINRCDFDSVNAGVRKVLEYSLLTPAERIRAETAASGLAERMRTGAGRIAAHDPELAEAVAQFIDRVAAIRRDG